MKRAGRVKLICFKKLSSGALDRFEVIVSESNKSATKARYSAMGYTVVNG